MVDNSNATAALANLGAHMAEAMDKLEREKRKQERDAQSRELSSFCDGHAGNVKRAFCRAEEAGNGGVDTTNTGSHCWCAR